MKCNMHIQRVCRSIIAVALVGVMIVSTSPQAFSATVTQTLNAHLNPRLTQNSFSEPAIDAVSLFSDCTARERETLMKIASFTQGQARDGMDVFDHVRNLNAIKDAESHHAIKLTFDLYAVSILMTMPYAAWHKKLLRENVVSSSEFTAIMKRYEQHSPLRLALKKVEEFDAVNTDLGFFSKKDSDKYEFQDYMNLIIQEAEDGNDILLLFAIELTKLHQYQSEAFKPNTVRQKKIYRHRMYRGEVINPFLAERLSFEETAKLFKREVTDNKLTYDKEFREELKSVLKMYAKRLHEYSDTDLFKDGVVSLPFDRDAVKMVEASFRMKVKKMCLDAGVKPKRIFVRLKSPDSVMYKMRDRDKGLWEIRDLMAVRIVTETSEDADILTNEGCDIGEIGFWGEERHYTELEKKMRFSNKNINSRHFGPVEFVEDEFEDAGAVEKLCAVLKVNVPYMKLSSGGMQESIDALNRLLREGLLYEVFEDEIEDMVTGEASEVMELYWKSDRSELEEMLLNRLVVERVCGEICPQNRYMIIYEMQIMDAFNYELYSRVGNASHQKYKAESGYGGQLLEPDRVIFTGNYMHDFRALKELVSDSIVVIVLESKAAQRERIRVERQNALLRGAVYSDKSSEFPRARLLRVRAPSLPVNVAAHQYVSRDLLRGYGGVEKMHIKDDEKHSSTLRLLSHAFKKCAEGESLKPGDVVRVIDAEKFVSGSALRKLRQRDVAVRAQVFLENINTAFMDKKQKNSLLHSLAMEGARVLHEDEGFKIDKKGERGQDILFLQFIKKKMELRSLFELYMAVALDVPTHNEDSVRDELLILKRGYDVVKRLSIPGSPLDRAFNAYSAGHGYLLGDLDDALQDFVVPIMPYLVRDGYIEKPAMRDLLYAIGSGAVVPRVIEHYQKAYFLGDGYVGSFERIFGFLTAA